MNQLTGIYLKMYEAWPKPIVIRSNDELNKATFGLLKSKGYLANLDSKKQGPESKESLGAQVFYNSYDFFLWLQERNGVENKIIAANAKETEIFEMQPVENIPEKYSFVTDSDGNILRSATLGR